jgi:hypothetical protein
VSKFVSPLGTDAALRQHPFFSGASVWCGEKSAGRMPPLGNTRPGRFAVPVCRGAPKSFSKGVKPLFADFLFALDIAR